MKGLSELFEFGQSAKVFIREEIIKHDVVLI